MYIGQIMGLSSPSEHTDMVNVQIISVDLFNCTIVSWGLSSPMNGPLQISVNEMIFI